MGCMDELMDKNLPYFVGGNLATLDIGDRARGNGRAKGSGL